MASELELELECRICCNKIKPFWKTVITRCCSFGIFCQTCFSRLNKCPQCKTTDGFDGGISKWELMCIEVDDFFRRTEVETSDVINLYGTEDIYNHVYNNLGEDREDWAMQIECMFEWIVDFNFNNRMKLRFTTISEILSDTVED